MKQSLRINLLPDKKNRFEKRIFDDVCNEIYQSRLLPMEKIWIDFMWVEQDSSRDLIQLSSIGRKLIYDALLQCSVIGSGCLLGFSDRFSVSERDPHIKIYLDDMQTIAPCSKNYIYTKHGD